MGYPPQPQGPYGQHPPQQPYGYSGPQPAQPGYGYQPPTSPPPPLPPPRRNVGVIILLAVGIPLLLLGGCAAVVLVLADTGREAVVTQADSPNMVMPSNEPVPSQPPTEQAQQQAKQESSAAAVGGAIALEGNDPGLKMTVTVNQVFNPATPAEDYMKPKTGTKLVAIQLTLSNAGQAVYDGSPENGAYLIDEQGQQYRSTYARIREGQGFDGLATINVGDTRKGVIVFAVPEAAKPVKFQYGLNSGFADQKGEWTLS